MLHIYAFVDVQDRRTFDDKFLKLLFDLNLA